MFEKKQEITEAVARLQDLFNSAVRGDFISRRRIEIASGFELDTPRGHYVFTKARKALLAAGVDLISIPGEGWGLATAQQQLAISSTRHSKRAMRQHGKAAKVLDVLPPFELPLHEQTVRASRLIVEGKAYTESRGNLQRFYRMLKAKQQARKNRHQAKPRGATASLLKAAEKACASI